MATNDYLRLTVGGRKRDLSDVGVRGRITRIIAPEPLSLTGAQVGPEVTPAREPIEVDAWVPYPAASIRIRARAVAWSRRAVCVEYVTPDGTGHRAWVWASAVERPPEAR